MFGYFGPSCFLDFLCIRRLGVLMFCWGRCILLLWSGHGALVFCAVFSFAFGGSVPSWVFLVPWLWTGCFWYPWHDLVFGVWTLVLFGFFWRCLESLNPHETQTHHPPHSTRTSQIPIEVFEKLKKISKLPNESTKAQQRPAKPQQKLLES